MVLIVVLVTIMLLIRGSVLEVTGYRNSPNPCVVLLVFVLFIVKTIIPGKHLVLFFFLEIDAP